MAGAVPAGGSGADRLGKVLEEGLDAEHPGAVLEGRAARMVDAQVVAHVRHAEDVAQSEHRRGLQAALAVGVAEHAPRLPLLGDGAAAAEQAALAVARQCPGEVLPEGRGTGGSLPPAGDLSSAVEGTGVPLRAE